MGVVVVAVEVDVSVVVVSVWVAELSTVGVFDSPGTVKAGVVSGSGSDAFSLLPPPHAARNGITAVSAATDATRWNLKRLALDGREPAPARRAVRNILRCQLLERAAAQPEVFYRPRQIALRRGERQQLADNAELFTGFAVDVDRPGLDLTDDFAVAPGA